MGRPCICCEKPSSSSSSSSSASSSESESQSSSSSSVSDSRSSSSVSTSSNCPHCVRCLLLQYTPSGSGGASRHGLAEIHQDFNPNSSAIPYVLDQNAANQGHLDRNATPVADYGDNLWLFEEHGDGLGTWAVGNQITECAWQSVILSPNEKAFWHLGTTCEVVWVTTNDPLTAEVVPETSPLALYIASKITNTWSLVVLLASQCRGGAFPPKPLDAPGNGSPISIQACGIYGGVGSNASFTASNLHIACSRNEVTNDDPLDPNNPNFMVTVSYDAYQNTFCTLVQTEDCLVDDWVNNYYFGPGTGQGWCPADGSFDPLYGASGGGGGFSPSMVYGSCEEIPCVYIGDGNGNWLPFQSCPNIEGQVCVCQPHPTEPSEYAGQMYVTNCGDAQ